jgi:hypothetical protein
VPEKSPLTACSKYPPAIIGNSAVVAAPPLVAAGGWVAAGGCVGAVVGAWVACGAHAAIIMANTSIPTITNQRGLLDFMILFLLS